MKRALLVLTLACFTLIVSLSSIPLPFKTATASAAAATHEPGCYDPFPAGTKITCPSGYKSADDQNGIAVQPNKYCYLVVSNVGENSGGNSTNTSYTNVQCNDLTTKLTATQTTQPPATTGESFSYGTDSNGNLQICETPSGQSCNYIQSITYFGENAEGSNTFSSNPYANGIDAAKIDVSSGDCSKGTYSQSGYSNSNITIADVGLLSSLQSAGIGPSCTVPAGAATLYCADGTQPNNVGQCDDGSQPSTTPPSNTATNPTCISTGGPLSWFTCEVINGISSLESHIENVVSTMLKTPPINLNPADCQSGSQDYTACIYNVWSNFRDFGDVVLVILLLVVIIVEAAGGGVIDAYSVRRILPRLLLTAILINLSIYIMAGMVDITNILGKGVFSLLTVPFKESGTYKINISGSGGNLFGVGGLLAIIGTTGSIWKLAAHQELGDAISFMALFVGLPVLFAVIGALLTIFFRSVLLVLLLMVSPIAFALYCLPNTEQYFRKWWGLLFKTLMVYPIVMVMFAACDLGAVVVSSFSPSGNEQWMGDLMSIVGVAAPLFLIPFAFKFSGGAIGSIHGALTNLSQKGFEAIKGNAQDPNSLQSRTRRNYRIGREVAGLTPRALTTRLNPAQVTHRGRERANARISGFRQAGLEQLRKQTEGTNLWQAVQGDSNVMRELAWYGSEREAQNASDTWHRASINDINAREEAGRHSPGAAGTLTAAAAEQQRQEIARQYQNRNSAIALAGGVGYNPANRRAAMLNQYQVGFEMERGQEGWEHAQRIADSISGGDEFQFRSIMDEYQAVAKGAAGRMDQAGNTDGNRTYNGNKSWNNGGLYEIGNGKPRTIQGSADYYSGVLDRVNRDALDERDQDFVDEAAERGVDPRQVAAEAVGAFYAEQDPLSNNAKGGVKDAAKVAKRRLAAEIEASPYIQNIVRTDPSLVIGGHRALPVAAADRFAMTRDVNSRTRTWETPDRIAQQAGAP